MATRTGKLVVDRKTGKIVEEMKEDQILVALYDPECASPGDYAFQGVLRSDFKLNRINELFGCNAALLKDPFGNVLWPKDWIVEVLPATATDKWFYIIHERLEPPPQDELNDAMYAGGAVLVLTSVPKECESLDLRTWLLFGIAQDFAPLERVRSQIQIAEKKRAVLKQKVSALPSIDVDGTPEQQAEMRKKLSDAMATHLATFDDELTALGKKRARIEKLLMTEPLELAAQPIDKPSHAAAIDKDETMDQYAKRVETRSWTVRFLSPRGDALASVALAKRDWNYVCLVQTRPQPRAFVEDDQLQNQRLSEKDMAKEINMRLVRLKRLRHGTGERLQLNANAETNQQANVKPWDEQFHISSIGAMYSGEWRMGEKHGRGKEVTNVGVYDGDFERGQRLGHGKLVYGKGTTVSGTFERRTRTYEYSKKLRDQRYAPSLLNGDAFFGGVEHGEHMKIEFPDGAIYEGEMTDGKITGYGTYTSSTGVVDEGSFLDGQLHGDDCSRRFPDGTTLRGQFEMGQLHGRGELRERNGDEYDGYFDLGAKSGRATSYFDQRQCKHVGFWFENTMNGRGECFLKDGQTRQSESTSTTDANAAAEDDWDFWYEGSFVRGQTQARHRFVDLKQSHKEHLPFTTNGKSEDKMPYLTLTLPSHLTKLERRRHANAARRTERERQYLQKQEFENLSLYYGLLDEFYEQWVRAQRDRKEDEVLEGDALDEVRAERAAALEFAENRLKFRKEKYDLSPRKRELAGFESYLERVTLIERVQLERARAWETSAMVVDMEKAATANGT